MNRTRIWVLFISLSLILHTSYSVEQEVKTSLINFVSKLSNNNGQPDPSLGWDLNSDPCKDQWKGIVCDSQTNNTVRKLLLDRSGLSGFFDPSSLCNGLSLASSLNVISLNGNNISGGIPTEIATCKQLARLQINNNQFSGKLPDSLSKLNNLKKLDISFNKFSGNLPDLSRISGLTIFLVQNNQLTGKIPKFDFSNLDQFNVSFNNFSGRIPDMGGKFFESSFLGNPDLCGDPLPNKCPSSNGLSRNQILMYSGYFAIGLLVVSFVLLKICRKKKSEQKVDAVNKIASVDDSTTKTSAGLSDNKIGTSKSDISFTSAESAMVSSSLVVLTSPVVNGLKFEDLLRAPAELLGRGKYGSLYRVNFDNGMVLAVKRIKDWAISTDEFKQRMLRIDQAKHPNVLPALAFYSSRLEKLLVYEFQQNGSLFRLLHGTQMGQTFDWTSRLGIAASIAEALAFMHQKFGNDGIAHGNLKSSNILLNKDMEPCISEYGLMVVDDHKSSNVNSSNKFKLDVHGFGIVLLELLTGKLVQNDGADLTTWVHSVVREEWTVEVFDKSLISEGASEGRMVNLLQVAVKCVNRSPEARPSMNQVASMINAIKEEEERSMLCEP